MQGKSHLVTGIATAVTVFDINMLVNHVEVPNFFSQGWQIVCDYLFEYPSLPKIVVIAISIVLYLLGLLLPDIDTPYSTLGKIICIPFIEHRTWTHAIWIPLGIGIASIWFRPIMFLAFGMLVHDFFDSFSMSSIKPFYPAKFEIGIPIYKVGTIMETLLVIITIIVSVFVTLGSLQHIYHFVNITI